MQCNISRSLLDRIASETRRNPAIESCGLLIGDDDGIVDAVAAANVASDPARSFEIDPFDCIRVSRSARLAGLRRIGHYHYHPSGNPTPSANDALRAQEDGIYWLIVSRSDVALWISRLGGVVHKRFERVALAVDDGAPCNRDRQPPIGVPAMAEALQGRSGA